MAPLQVCDHVEVDRVNEIEMTSAENSAKCSKLVRGVAQAIPARYIITVGKGVDCCKLRARLGWLQGAKQGVIASVLSSSGGSANCTCNLMIVEANTAGVRMVRMYTVVCTPVHN